MTRVFLAPADLGGLVATQFGSDRRLVGLDRLTGGTKKGVYRLTLDDATTAIVYVWSDAENYWPPPRAVPDDPFVDASGVEVFAACHAALTGVGVRVPELLLLDPDGTHPGSALALVEDVGSVRLEQLMESDPGAARATLVALGGALRRMHTTTRSGYGKIGLAGSEGHRPAEDVVVDRALSHLDAVVARDARIATARERIAEHVRTLRAAVQPRREYALVHGELGPDHVFVTPAGEPVLIDVEGLAWFDVEWEHAFLRKRFGAAYPLLDPVPLDPDRLALYRYAQVLSLIEGPLRIADTDFPDRQWMLDLAEHHIGEALAGARRQETR